MRNFLFAATILTLLVAQFCLAKYSRERSYVDGYGDGGKYVIERMKEVIKQANDSCDVVALPIVGRDTVIYFLSSKFCELDTVLTDRWKRIN